MEPREDRWVGLRRARWRLRGAWAAPAFALLTVVDAVVLHTIPFAGDGRVGWIGALLLATFLNLLVVAVLAPLLGLWLRRRDATLPAFAARDRAGVIGLAAVTALLLAGGLLHQGAVRREEDKLAAQALAARRWFAREAPAAYRANLALMTTWKAGPDFYRTCVPGPEARRALCVLVETDQSPPGVTRDRSQEPNEALAGADADLVRFR